MDPLLRYMPMMFLSRVGSALPPSSTVKSCSWPARLYASRECPCFDLFVDNMLSTANFAPPLNNTTLLLSLSFKTGTESSHDTLFTGGGEQVPRAAKALASKFP